MRTIQEFRTHRRSNHSKMCSWNSLGDKIGMSLYIKLLYLISRDIYSRWATRYIKDTGRSCNIIVNRSSLGTLFSSLVYNRIENEKAKTYSHTYWTTENIFTIFSLIKSLYLKHFIYLFCWLSKSMCDSRCRKRLLYRVKDVGLKWRIFDIIKCIPDVL